MNNKKYINEIIDYLKKDRPAHAHASMRKYMKHLGYNYYEIEKQPINFNEYQSEATKTAAYPNIGNNIYYPTLGLCGESGEVAEKIKKIFRDDNGIVTNESKLKLEKELGDVLWYVAQLATELDLSLDEIATNNIRKLQSRKERNQLHGSGDNR